MRSACTNKAQPKCRVPHINQDLRAAAAVHVLNMAIFTLRVLDAAPKRTESIQMYNGMWMSVVYSIILVPLS
jgi:hypothetical protein